MFLQTIIKVFLINFCFRILLKTAIQTAAGAGQGSIFREMRICIMHVSLNNEEKEKISHTYYRSIASELIPF